MSRDFSRVVILSEDQQLECFIRRFLIQRNWDRRNIRVETHPKAKGSGEQWVRERFVKELKAYRSRSTRAASCLIVATDADTLTVDERVQWFEQVCQDAQIPFRQPGERIVFVVPKRNIETWFAYLRGEMVDEKSQYPRYPSESDCRDDVAKLDEMCRQNKLTPEPPPSLEIACTEFKLLAE